MREGNLGRCTCLKVEQRMLFSEVIGWLVVFVESLLEQLSALEAVIKRAILNSKINVDTEKKESS